MGIPEQLKSIQDRITLACQAAHRAPDSVLLIAVSKTHPAEKITTAYAVGQRHFGENYVQECIEKVALLKAHRADIIWHFIGPLQSNKTRMIAEELDWVQSIDRLKIAQRLSEQRPTHLEPLQVLVQVNISGELTKSGVVPKEALDLCQAILELPQLALRGLMAIPEPGIQANALEAFHAQFAALQNQLGTRCQFDTLSVGMSDDMESAIAAGSTMVRVGTAIFGAR